MKYMGSKARFAKYLKVIIENNLNGIDAYIEPFVGGGNLICEINHHNKIGIDFNLNTILALNFIKNNIGDIPKDKSEFTEDMYKNIKQHKESGLRGYVGYSLSYGGKWFGGWCRDKDGKRDYVAESYRNAVKQSAKIQDCLFLNKSYDDIPDKINNSLIYCDPPYKNTTKYSNNFNHDDFYNWARLMSKNNIVMISEYDMPDDFVCIWSINTTSSLTKDTGAKKSIERLFVHNSIINKIIL